jgi:hypothetical protein
MNSSTLVSKLNSVGYTLYHQEGKIRLRYTLNGDPDPAQITPLLDELKQHKAEVMEFLKNQDATPCLQVEKIEAMPLNEFAKTNLALKVNSSILGEPVYFAPNDHVAEKIKGDGFVTYTAKELEYLAEKGLTPEELREIHETKKIFPGSRIVN